MKSILKSIIEFMNEKSERVGKHVDRELKSSLGHRQKWPQSAITSDRHLMELKLICSSDCIFYEQIDMRTGLHICYSFIQTQRLANGCNDVTACRSFHLTAWMINRNNYVCNLFIYVNLSNYWKFIEIFQDRNRRHDLYHKHKLDLLFIIIIIKK